MCVHVCVCACVCAHVCLCACACIAQFVIQLVGTPASTVHAPKTADSGNTLAWSYSVCVLHFIQSMEILDSDHCHRFYRWTTCKSVSPEARTKTRATCSGKLTRTAATGVKGEYVHVWPSHVPHPCLRMENPWCDQDLGQCAAWNGQLA